MESCEPRLYAELAVSQGTAAKGLGTAAFETPLRCRASFEPRSPAAGGATVGLRLVVPLWAWACTKCLGHRVPAAGAFWDWWVPAAGGFSEPR